MKWVACIELGTQQYFRVDEHAPTEVTPAMLEGELAWGTEGHLKQQEELLALSLVELLVGENPPTTTEEILARLPQEQQFALLRIKLMHAPPVEVRIERVLGNLSAEDPAAMPPDPAV